MLTERQVRAMFAAQDEARANEVWQKMQRGELRVRLGAPKASEPEVVTVTDDDLCREDVEFAAVLVGNAGHLGFEELMSEARRVNDESAQAFLWSVEHALNGSDAR